MSRKIRKTSRSNNQNRGPGANDEEKMQDEHEKGKVVLKNGTSHYLSIVFTALDFLRDIADNEPRDFQLLVAMAKRKYPENSSSFLRKYKSAGVILKDGSLHETFQDVLLSGAKESPEGVVLVDPFFRGDEKQNAMVKEHEVLCEDRIERIAKRIRRSSHDEDDLPNH